MRSIIVKETFNYDHKILDTQDTDFGLCNKCGSNKITKKSWRPMSMGGNADIHKALDKLKMNQVTVYTCSHCGNEMRRG